ncbi:MAG TPA: hypothetical protein VNG90_03755, partial [Candidatus Acidoferrum sp.]|nr:hypothetical protein [Candidatus Acidoferrum sp.]
MTLLLGKLAAEDDTRTLSFERYFKGGLSGLPETFGNYQPVNEWRMLLNDKLGDCVPAACIHQI